MSELIKLIGFYPIVHYFLTKVGNFWNVRPITEAKYNANFISICNVFPIKFGGMSLGIQCLFTSLVHPVEYVAPKRRLKTPKDALLLNRLGTSISPGIELGDPKSTTTATEKILSLMKLLILSIQNKQRKSSFLNRIEDYVVKLYQLLLTQFIFQVMRVFQTIEFCQTCLIKKQLQNLEVFLYVLKQYVGLGITSY